jgi:hypothetical protein
MFIIKELNHFNGHTEVRETRHYKTLEGLEKWWEFHRKNTKDRTDKQLARKGFGKGWHLYGCEALCDDQIVASFLPWKGVDTSFVQPK